METLDTLAVGFALWALVGGICVFLFLFGVQVMKLLGLIE